MILLLCRPFGFFLLVILTWVVNTVPVYKINIFPAAPNLKDIFNSRIKNHVVDYVNVELICILNCFLFLPKQKGVNQSQ